MKAVIYTRDDSEYELISRVISTKNNGFEVFRAPLDGHGHYSVSYDIAAVAIDGAEGMEIMLELSDRNPDTKMIWITNDRHFAGMAIRKHISGFIVRPYHEVALSSAIDDAVKQCSGSGTWHFAGQKRK